MELHSISIKLFAYHEDTSIFEHYFDGGASVAPVDDT